MDIPTNPRQHAGNVVERERRRRGWTQQAAVNAGAPTSVPSWRKVETGAEDVSASTCAAVDRAFGWPVGTTEALRAGDLTEPPAPSMTAPPTVNDLPSPGDPATSSLRVRLDHLEDLVSALSRSIARIEKDVERILDADVVTADELRDQLDALR